MQKHYFESAAMMSASMPLNTNPSAPDASCDEALIEPVRDAAEMTHGLQDALAPMKILQSLLAMRYIP